MASHILKLPQVREVGPICPRILMAWLNLVLHMLSEYIGKKQFLEGVTLYLKKHPYGNTVTRDLWDSILAASGGFFFAHMGTLT
jgi:aminopeptidase 2